MKFYDTDIDEIPLTGIAVLMAKAHENGYKQGIALGDARCKQGAAAERAAIVAWLMQLAREIRYSQYDLDRHKKAGNLEYLAKRIQRGDHLPSRSGIIGCTICGSMLNYKWEVHPCSA